jgi:hypothetical protein
MDEIKDALRSLADRYEARSGPAVESVMTTQARRRSGAAARRSVPLALVIGVAASMFGVGVATASVFSSSPVVHREHPMVPLTTSANCPVLRADTSVSSFSGPAGTAVEVSGPLYYLNSENELWVPGNDAIQAWWNLDPSDYASASTAAVEAANGGDATPTKSGGELVGEFITNGACSFDLKFNVPDVGPGKYPISIMGVAGSDGSTTVYGSFIYEVT